MLDFIEVIILLLVRITLVLHEEGTKNDVTEAVANDVAHEWCDQEAEEVIQTTDVSEEAEDTVSLSFLFVHG